MNVGGQLVSATVGLRPPYDPAGKNIKGGTVGSRSALVSLRTAG